MGWFSEKISFTRPTCPKDCKKVKQASSWTLNKCGQLLGIASNGQDLFINNHVLYHTALQLLEWAQDQPSPLIRKDKLKQLLGDALKDDVHRRIFRDYLKTSRNSQKKASWIHSTTINGCEFSKLD